MLSRKEIETQKLDPEKIGYEGLDLIEELFDTCKQLIQALEVVSSAHVLSGEYRSSAWLNWVISYLYPDWDYEAEWKKLES